MTDRPIIFSAPMVRALLAGRKTQTRRLATSPLRLCAVGDRLWVRENWRRAAWCPAEYSSLGGKGMAVDVQYVANDERLTLRDPTFDIEKAHQSLVPSIHMPRWASRLTLIVEDVRVQRLQEISEADAIAEGIEPVDTPHGRGWKSYETYPDGSRHPFSSVPNRSPVTSYRELWEALHGADTWAANPEVVALTFNVVRGNIDRSER